MYTKKNTRVTFRSNKRSNFKRNSNYSIGKPRNKGNVTQQYNKYFKLAKEAFSSGDRIQSEYYYQFTDHYYRLMLELGINLEETDNQEERNIDESQDHMISNNENSENIEIKKNKDLKDFIESESESESESDAGNLDSNEVSSIESIPFISKPVKKKSARVKKSQV